MRIQATTMTLKKEENRMTLSIEKKHINIGIGVLIAVLIGVFTFAFNMGMQVNDMKQEIDNLHIGLDHVVKQHEEDKGIAYARIQSLENDNTDLKIKLATIETKLTSIETLLLDIKHDIDAHRREKIGG